MQFINNSTFFLLKKQTKNHEKGPYLRAFTETSEMKNKVFNILHMINYSNIVINLLIAD